MKLKIIFFAFSFSLLASNVIHCQESKKFSYFPLSVGNKWFFSQGNDGIIKLKLEIQKDTILNDGHSYVKFNLYSVGIDSSSILIEDGYSYLRRENNLLFEYPDITIMDYDMSIGDTVFSFRNEPYPSRLDTVINKNVFGRELSTYYFSFTPYDFFTYTDSIGFNTFWATSWHNWVPEYLLGCEIDGKVFGDVITGIKNINELSVDYKLYQNYPNPFNPTTIIQYSIPKAGFVSLIIYDMLGKEIATLVKDYKNTGVYKVVFNESKMASGIYFYTLSSGKYKKTNKMILLR
ncbi:MAG: T9SS type A sorting domain-containing protein [Bacteroidetes bacterium]|nr:T9SS type A sorting domain-containing protein [Bacteroidota bacterium]